MADNSDALVRARRRDSQAKRARAAETLRAMLDTGRGDHLRRACSPGRSVGLTAKQVRQLQEDAVLLRQRLARTLGTEADIARGRATAPLLDQLEDRAAELFAENARLRERVSALEGELGEAMDSLEAARIANRDLIALVNR